MCRLPSLLALAAALVALLPAEASAIPAFARRYRFSCTTCHAPFPRLKAFGDEFAARGFALEPGQAPARAQVDLGDDLLQLPRDFPIALRFDGFAAATDRTAGAARVDLETPWTFKILVGGEVAERVAVYAYYILEHGEPGKIEDAYVQLSRLLGLPVDVLFGQFQLCDPIAKRELRLERQDYEILTTRVGASQVNLTYDRGLGLATGVGPVGALLTVTNGNGIGPGADLLDDDKYKNFGLHLSGDVGPVGLGAYGFFGKQADAAGVVNETLYLGPQVSVDLGLVQLAAVWLERRDSNAGFLAGAHEELVTRGGFLEGVVYPMGPDGRLAIAALYNYVDSDDRGARRDSAAVTASWLHRRNVRLTAEVGQDFREEAWSASLGTVAAF